MQLLMDSMTLSQIRGQVLLMDPIPPLNIVYSLLIQEESKDQLAMDKEVYILLNLCSCSKV